MNKKEFSEIWNKAAAKKYAAYLLHVHGKDYALYPHIKVIVDYIQTIIDWWEDYEKGIIKPRPKNLIINTPPQVGKSMCLAETMPSFVLGRFPNYKVITTAYGGDLPAKFGTKNLQKFEKYAQELWGLQVDPRTSAKTAWQVKDREGRFVSAGIMGGITGESANLLIIDDPYKNRTSADSKVIRKRVIEEWNDTLKTRVNPKNGFIIIVHTRWREDDLTGMLLATEPESWNVIRIPAECDSKDDPLGRAIGDPICPEMGRTKEWAAKIKKKESSRTWNSLFQQNPFPEDGEILKREWWQYYKVLPAKFDTVVLSVDCTFKDTDTSDFVVMQVWGKLSGQFYLIDQVRGKMDFPTTQKTLQALCNLYPHATYKYIEDKANGSAIIQTLRKDIPGIIPINPRGSKEARVQAISAYIESGNVFIPDPMGPDCPYYIKDFIDECTIFPFGKHDDQVDAMSQAISKLSMLNENKKREGRKLSF